MSEHDVVVHGVVYAEPPIPTFGVSAALPQWPRDEDAWCVPSSYQLLTGQRPSHRTEIWHDHKKSTSWSVKCKDCPARWLAASEPEAKERADAHGLFTHINGSYLCGHSYCAADRAIKRLRKATA